MDFKWLSDMLNSIGIRLGSDDPGKPKDVRAIEMEIDRLNLQLAKKEKELSSNKMISRNIKASSGMIFLFIFFILSSFWGAIITTGLLNVLASNFDQKNHELKNEIRNGKARLETKRVELDKLKNTLGHGNSSYADIEEINREVSQAQVKEAEYEEPQPETQEDTGEDRYPDSTKEARIAYINLEKVSEMLPELKEHDVETAALFEDVFDSAMKTAKFIHGNPEKENRAFLFYNHVETLEKWLRGILDLEKKDVYDSLIKNVKDKARIALPVLQEKINKEYYKFVNPDIADLESEMTVMSKEQY